MTTCTVQNAVTGKCGRPAVYTFQSRDGETFGECAEHYHGPAPEAVSQVGSEVAVYRHGKEYVGRVTRVTRTGKVFARVVYGNGATREVEV